MNKQILRMELSMLAKVHGEDRFPVTRLQVYERVLINSLGDKQPWDKIFQLVMEEDIFDPKPAHILSAAKRIGISNSQSSPLTIREKAESWVDQMVEFSQCGMQHKLTSEQRHIMTKVCGFDGYSLRTGSVDPKFNHKRWVGQVETYLERKERDPESIALPQAETQDALGIGSLVKGLT